VTCWHELITDQLDVCGESWDDIIETVADTAGATGRWDLEQFDYWHFRTVSFTLWSERRVYFPIWDQGPAVGSVSRSPDEQPTPMVGF